jgi:uncharacterized protein (TIGR03067 family)
VNKFLVLPFALLLALSSGWAFAEDKAKPTAEELNKADLEKLTGAWVVAKIEGGGAELPKELFADVVLTIDGEKYKVEGIPEGPQSGVVTIDATKEIKEITIEPKEGPEADKPIKAIYQYEDDKLTVCYDLSGKAFPKEFKTEPNTQQLLIVYERKKDEKKEEKKDK